MRHYSGSSALTAALCAEALAHYKNKLTMEQNNDLIRHIHIQKLALGKLGPIQSSLSKMAATRIGITSDTKITSLAYDVQKALLEKKIFISSKLIECLSLATLYGWMAYTIYDGISDKECDPSLIHCANLFSRKLNDLYDEINKDIPGAMALLKDLLEMMDNGNIHEKKHPHFDDHKNLAERSIGYALAPLTALLYMGHPPDSKEGKNMRRLFEHYIIARQLHDDAHDWESDLVHGTINSAAALIIKRSDRKKNDTPLSAMRMIFQRDVAIEVSRLIEFHINRVRKGLSRSIFFSKTSFLSKELERLERNAASIRLERDKTLTFLENWGKNALPGINQ